MTGSSKQSSKNESRAGFLSGESLYQDVITYCDFGENRTASEAEMSTAEWISGRLNSAGFETKFQAFNLRQYTPSECWLEVNGKQFPCFPLWPPRFTGLNPLQARLAIDPRLFPGNIAVVTLPYEESLRERLQTESKGSGRTSENAEYLVESGRHQLTDAIGYGAAAVVAITNCPSGDTVAFNTPASRNPWPVPVALVAGRHEAELVTMAEEGAAASVLLNGTESPRAEARNVTGQRTVDGKPFIIITTPYTGWFRAGGERGPGLALFLALARWAGERKPGVSYIFNCNSGHELNLLGMKEYLKSFSIPPEKVIAWLYLGKNIATWDFETENGELKLKRDDIKYRLISRESSFLPLLKEAFAVLPEIKPVIGSGLGEIKMVPEGYAVISLTGSGNPYKHTNGDGPQATAPELLEPFALALTLFLQLLEARIIKENKRY